MNLICRLRVIVRLAEAPGFVAYVLGGLALWRVQRYEADDAPSRAPKSSLAEAKLLPALKFSQFFVCSFSAAHDRILRAPGSTIAQLELRKH